MSEIYNLPYGKKLTDAITYIYRRREWLGEGYDTLIWWEDRERKCHHFQSHMGETTHKEPVPKIIEFNNTDKKVFDKFIRKLIDNGIMELQIDENPKILNNYNDFYFVQIEDSKSHSFCLLHGYHSDLRFKEIQNAIYEYIT